MSDSNRDGLLAAFGPLLVPETIPTPPAASMALVAKGYVLGLPAEERATFYGELIAELQKQKDRHASRQNGKRGGAPRKLPDDVSFSLAAWIAHAVALPQSERTACKKFVSEYWPVDRRESGWRNIEAKRVKKLQNALASHRKRWAGASLADVLFDRPPSKQSEKPV